MIKPILIAAAIAFSAVSVAGAATVGPITSPKATASSDLVEVGKKGKGKGKARHHRGHKGKAHSRSRAKHVHVHRRNVHVYRAAPRGWRRYSYRPYGWATRGCIIIGPVWYCPW